MLYLFRMCIDSKIENGSVKQRLMEFIKYKVISIKIPGYKDCLAINAYGDSMLPLIKSGEIILIKRWMENFIDWGKIYLIAARSGYRAIKRVYPDNNDYIICKSENENGNLPFVSIHDSLIIVNFKNNLRFLCL